MGLGPMEISGAISRIQDFATIRQNEENKGTVDQTNFAGQFQKEVQNRTNTVKRADDTNNEQKKFDAKEKGSNEYHGDGGKRRDKLPGLNVSDGSVKVKGSTSSFDIRI